MVPSGSPQPTGGSTPSLLVSRPPRSTFTTMFSALSGPSLYSWTKNGLLASSTTLLPATRNWTSAPVDSARAGGAARRTAAPAARRAAPARDPKRLPSNLMAPPRAERLRERKGPRQLIGVLRRHATPTINANSDEHREDHR